MFCVLIDGFKLLTLVNVAGFFFYRPGDKIKMIEIKDFPMSTDKTEIKEAEKTIFVFK